MRRILLLSTLLAIPTAAALPSLDGDGQSIFDNGLVVGLGVAGAGLATLGGVLYYLGVGGMRHIDKDNVLDHPMRQSLLQVVEHEPGVHLRALAHRHGTAVTNTQWHLRKLEMAGLIATRKVEGRRLYYPRSGGVEMRDKAVQNAALQNPNARRIVAFVEANPGINQRSLADGLEMNPGTVRWHLRKLESAALIRAVQEGTQNRYFTESPAVQRPPRPRARSAHAAGEQEAAAPQE